MSKKTKDLVTMTLRIAGPLHAQTVEAAAADGRAISNFIIQAVREKLARSDYLDDQLARARRDTDDGK